MNAFEVLSKVRRRLGSRLKLALSQGLGKLFYQQRVDEKGNIILPKGLKRFCIQVNQQLMENGYSPPWVLKRHECHRRWKYIVNELNGNKPQDYARKPMGIVEFLHEFWAPEVVPENSILELGCNCGANLNGLCKLGYLNLSGIDINEKAIEEMQRTFPALSNVAAVSIGSLEELLPKTPTHSIDVIYTMAVLIHLHPTGNSIFSEMVRVAKKYIVVVEAETANCNYVFARNYRRVFQRLGCSQLKSAMITQGAFPNVSRDYDGYIARMFTVPKSEKNG